MCDIRKNVLVKSLGLINIISEGNFSVTKRFITCEHMLKTIITQKKAINSFINFSFCTPKGIKNIMKHNMPANRVMMVVPGMVGINKKDMTGKNSIKKLTYFLTNFTFELS
jgi:hypothetical protein